MACLIETLIKNSFVSVEQLKKSTSSLPSSSSSSTIQETLNSVNKTLERVQDLIPEAELKSKRNEAFHVWMQELRCFFYDLDDIFDHFLFQIQCKPGEFISGSSRKRKRREEEDEDHPVSNSWNASVAKDMCAQLDSKVKKFDEISRDWDKLCLEQGNGRTLRSVVNCPPPSSSFMDGCGIFGREEDKLRLISMLISDNSCKGPNISVVPVVGMAGIGKTTLAKIVYNDPTVCSYFEKKGWACAGEDFDTVRLTKAIIGSLSSRSCNGTDLVVLQQILSKEVSGKKVLLVLEDVWNENQSLWNSFREPLCSAKMVRIIFTTENVQAADVVRTAPSYKLDQLSEDQSWLLFQQEAFDGIEIKDRQNLVKVGKQIVGKWHGLPLVVKAIGGALCNEDDEHQWANLLKSELWELVDIRTEIFPAIESSFNRMPAYLKPCLLYCSVFPKDKFFAKGQIIQLWMAQGYLIGAPSDKLEETGNKYFIELQKRSFFDCFHRGSSDLEMFKLSSIVYDLARSILGKEVMTVSSSSEKEVSKSPNLVRHLVAREMPANFASVTGTKALRTLFAYDHNFVSCVLCYYPSLLAYLRALTLDVGPREQIPDLIGDLKHLRYMCLICPYVKNLPESICSLFNLQTLDICGSDVFEELPTNLDNLINLRHLVLQGGIRKVPESICHLSNLHTLALSSSKIDNLPTDLGKLSNLHCLYLECIRLRTLPESITSLQNLQQLTVLNGKHEAGLNSSSHDLIDSVTKLLNLQKLYLPSHVCFPQGIGRLSNLRHLSKFSVGNHGSSCAGLIELKDLLNLGPKLSISGLRNCIDPEDSLQVNLRNKPQIECLELSWTEGICTHGDEKTVNRKWKNNQDLDELVLENLCPHFRIKELSIYGYRGTAFPSWMGSLSFCNLINLELIDCEFCVTLPMLGQLPYLTGLKLSGLNSIKSLGFEFYSDRIDPDDVNKVCFPLLAKLEIQKMRKLETWQYDTHNTACFPILRKLYISDCPMLQTFPSFRSSELLCIRRLDSLRFLALHNSNELKRLYIYKCSQLESVVGLPSSVELITEECPRLSVA